MRYMRFILNFVFLALFFACFTYIISVTVVVQGIDDIETTHSIKCLDRVLERLEQLKSQLSWQTRSLISSSFQHQITEQNIEQIKEKFSYNFLVSLRLRGLVYIAADGTPLLTIDNDQRQRFSVSDAKLQVYQKICRHLIKLDQHDIEDVLTIDNETYIISAQQIYGENEVLYGVLITLKTLANEFSAGAETNSLSRFSILPAKSYSAVQDSIEYTEEDRNYKITLNKNDIFAYALVFDMFNHPVCCIEARTERSFFTIGDDITFRNFILMLTIGLIFLVYSMYLMHRLEKDIMNREIEYRSKHDGLTGLLNKSSLINLIDSLIAQFSKTKNVFSVIFINLNRFRTINDSYGFESGDQLLFAVGQQLCQVSPKEYVARFNGDKFCIVAIMDKDKACDFAVKLEETLCASFFCDKKEIFLKCNIGLCSFPTEGANAHELIRRAELAMYNAKNNPNNNIVVFDSEMEQVVNQRLNLENALTKALDDNELTVFYQPKVDITACDVFSCEALVRWKLHNKNVWVSPAEFIPLAEELGLVHRLDMFVLRQACKQLHCWRDAGFYNVRVAVNMSARSILKDDFVDRVQQILHDENISTSLIEMEITETSVMTDIAFASKTMRELHAQGIRISLDDFGVGYSSLSYLNSMPISCLKIDKSFIDGLTTLNANSCEIVRGTLALAEGLGKETVAEGVEDMFQLQYLKSLGCHVIQGYLFSKPLNANDFTNYLLHKTELIKSVLHSDHSDCALLV